MIEALKLKQTLKAAELQDGDIICFQRFLDRKPSERHFLDKITSEKQSGGDKSSSAYVHVHTAAVGTSR